MAYGIVKVDNITFDNGGSDQNVTVSGLYRATTSGVTVSGTIAAGTVSGVTVIGSTTVSGATVTGTTANFTSGNFNNLISAAATMSGALIMANQQQVRFREAVGNGVNHIALQAPAIVSADQTITLPDQTGTVVTTGDNGSVTSTMILDGTIVNADISASATIADTKLATISTAGKVSDSALPATISSNITGNAATVSNGVYTNANATITAQHSHQTNNTAIANSGGGLARLEVIGTGGAAFLQFHRPNAFGAYFGLDSDSQFKIGGWSFGAVSYPILHTGNFNTYVPTLAGVGATGTWGINVTGNAGTATTLATARTIGGVSFNGSANINLPGVNTSGTQNTSGNAATATNLSSNRTFALTGDVTGSVSSNLSSGMSISANVADAGLVASAAGAVGSYALARNSTGGSLANNATAAGSSLFVSYANDGGVWATRGITFSGTWRNMSGAALANSEHGIFQRIS
jgi:hypothetical protein